MINIFILFLLWSGSVFAATAEGPSPQQVNEQILKQKQIYDQQQAQQQKALLALDAIERKVKSTVLEKSKVQSDLDQMSWSLKNSEQRKLRLQQEVLQGKLDLTRRLRLISKISGPDILKGILLSKNQLSLQRNLKILQLLARTDKEKLQTLSLSQKQLSIEVELLEKSHANLVHKQKQLIEAEKSYQENFKLKNKVVQSLKKNQLFSRQRIAELQMQGRDLQIEDLGLLDQLVQITVAEMKGQLKWPLKGPVVQSYGQSLSAEHPYHIQNSGLFISSNENSKIKPVFDGKVVAVENVKELGNVVVIDHGDHIYSVYASAAKPLVLQGDLVKTNSIITTAAYNSLFNKSGVYLEIRHYNQPQNPLDWMKGSPL